MSLNDDLLESPFDTELEMFAWEVKNLIVPIMNDIQKCGLKKRFLYKFKKDVDIFYKRAINDKQFKSDLAQKYQNSLFDIKTVFLHFLNKMGFLGTITLQKERSDM